MNISVSAVADLGGGKGANWRVQYSQQPPGVVCGRCKTVRPSAPCPYKITECMYFEIYSYNLSVAIYISVLGSLQSVPVYGITLRYVNMNMNHAH